ncbi:MAG: GGDEF domain-containing protein [Lachnospiraceae bacterium]|nr:GGDEF domain-containing protein [Lachnospiraceae bacterium]
MNNKSINIQILHAIYCITVIAILGYAVFGTDLTQGGSKRYDWSRGWETDDGRIISTDDIRAGAEGITISKELPDAFNADDSLCFVADNISFTLSIGDDEIYSFTSEENLTGKGYGILRQSFPLHPQYAGKVVTITLRSVFDDSGRDTDGDGQIQNMCICPEKAHTAILLLGRLLSALLSLLIIFFGVLLSGIYIAVPRKDLLLFNMAALGLMAILLGLWCFIQTGFIQLITGRTIGLRILTYVLVIFVEYPTLVFVNSYTILKKSAYTKIMFAFWLMSFASLFVMRFTLGIDCHNTLPLFSFSYGVVLFFLACILIEDIMYCKANNITRNRKHFVTGAICFTACSAVEILSYVTKEKIISSNGNMLRIGLCFFFFEMLMQFLYWWSGEQEGKEQLIRIGFNDLMTGTGNRRAFEEFSKTGIIRDGTYGYLMCDINGLKQVNDVEGHDAGDALIKDVASCMLEVFGEKKVFRLGGDEFVAISDTDNEGSFQSMVRDLRGKLDERKRSASLGAVFVENNNMDFREVRKVADKLMYDEKERFYQGRHERRRRR